MSRTAVTANVWSLSRVVQTVDSVRHNAKLLSRKRFVSEKGHIASVSYWNAFLLSINVPELLVSPVCIAANITLVWFLTGV